MRRRLLFGFILMLVLGLGFAGGLGLREYYAFRTQLVSACDGTPIQLSTRRGQPLGIEFFIGGWAPQPIKITIANSPDEAAIEETVVFPRLPGNRISYALAGEWYGDFSVRLEGEECSLLLVYRFHGILIDTLEFM